MKFLQATSRSVMNAFLRMRSERGPAMNKRKSFDPKNGGLLVTGHLGEAVVMWSGFQTPDDIVSALSTVREYIRNSCTGRFISGETLCEPLPRKEV